MLESQFHDDLLKVMRRIADAQEKLLAIAEEARKERTSLSAKMQEAFRRPLDLPPPPVEGK